MEENNGALMEPDPEEKRYEIAEFIDEAIIYVQERADELRVHPRTELEEKCRQKWIGICSSLYQMRALVPAPGK